jgi:hypothetical protein
VPSGAGMVGGVAGEPRMAGGMLPGDPGLGGGMLPGDPGLAGGMLPPDTAMGSGVLPGQGAGLADGGGQPDGPPVPGHGNGAPERARERSHHPGRDGAS